MPGKKKKEKKKKGKGRDGTHEPDSPTHIAAALMPSATIAAVPRSPPPPPALPEMDPALTSHVLSASLLGPMFTTGPEVEGVRSDTDTSLYDYENARPTYSSVEFRGTSTGDSAMLRARPSQPLPEYYEDNDDDSDKVAALYYDEDVLHEPRPRAPSPGEPLYTEVRRGRQVKKEHFVNDSDVRSSGESVPMSSSMRRYAEEDERSLRMTGQSQRSTLRSQRSPSPRNMLRSPSPSPSHTAQNVERRIARGSPSSTGEQSKREDLGHSTSLKLQALEARNLELISQQQESLQQLQEQQRQQTEVMQRLADKSLLASQRPDESMRDIELGSLLQETQSITEGTLTKQDSFIKSLQTRTAINEQEKHELQELNEQLQAEINSLRRLASIKDTGPHSVTFDLEEGDGMGTQVLLLKKQLQDYKDERDTLKSSVHRLNSELSRYQANYRVPPQGEQEEVIGLPTKGPTPSWLINTKYLAPLFLAYDDRLAEKDAIIQEFEEEFENFELRVDDVVKENQRLHLRVEQSDTAGPMSITEWRQLQEQCRVVLEENQLLMEQLELQQDKTKDLHKTHVQEVSKLSKKLVVVEAERSDLQQQMKEVKDTYSDLRKQHETMMIDGSVKMGLEEHLSAISSLRRTLEEEQNKHMVEVENLKTKMTTMQAERKGLSIELEDIKSENKQLTAEMKALQKSQRKSIRKYLILQRALQEVETKELSASKYLTTIVKVAEKTAQERDTLAQVAQNRDRQRKQAITKAMEGNVATAKMEEKLKMVKIKATEKLHKAVNRIKEQDDDFNQQRAEYEREIKHLRLLLREREDMLEELAGEKRCVEDDLETMWQVTTADNRHMRETYRKSLRKLKEHPTLDAILSDTEERNEIC